MSDTPKFGQVAIYQHLRALIGTPNAWRTSVELCTELDAVSDNDKLRVQQGLHKLAKGGRITRKTRPGTKIYECMALILDEKDQLRAPRTKAAPPRAEIITPAAGPVGLRQEAVPAPRLPEPTPEAREAVERLVRSPTPALTLADVLAKHKAARQPLRPPATHKCTVCGAHWIYYLDEGSWSLHSETCGACCDNAPMGDQIVPIDTPTEVRVVPMEHDPTSYIDEVSTPTSPPPMGEPPELAGIAERCAEDDELTDPIEDEIYDLIELAQRGTQRVTIERVYDKVHVLMILAKALRSRFGFDTSPTAALLDEIATDLERVAE